MINKYNAILEKMTIQENDRGILSDFDFAVKDNINIKGTKMTGSSKLLENYVSIYNATVIDKLLNQGALLKYKTSMDELAMGGDNRSAATGVVKNPYDLSRIAGGSSGGSAALVASKEVRAALGTDTGDSVRKPASYCGIVGVKPSYGRISKYGVIPYASSLDHVAYFSQNVEDAALICEVLSGYDVKDLQSSQNDVEKYSELLDLNLEGKRIGVFRTVHKTIKDQQLLDKYNKFERLLEDKGAIIVDKEMDLHLLRALFPTYLTIANAESTSNHASLDGVRFGRSIQGDDLESLMKNTRSQFSLSSKKRYIFGMNAFTYHDNELIFNKAKRVRKLLVDQYLSLFEDVDILISLASPKIAPRIDENNVIDVNEDEVLVADNYMVLDNFAGTPSMTIPLLMHQNMPVGLNLSAKPFKEADMFAYAFNFEKIIDWKGRL